MTTTDSDRAAGAPTIGVASPAPIFETLIAPIVERTLEPCRAGARRRRARRRPRSTKSCWSADRPGFRSSAAWSPSCSGRTPHSELNPDEVVALGAAVQADILVTGNREMLLLDVTPLSLGIETMGGVTSKIILRNSTIPGDRQRDVHDRSSTTRPPSTSTCCRASASWWPTIARLPGSSSAGIPPMPAGMPRVQVQFQIDANGILSVTARELRTDVEQTIEVKPSYGLTDEEVERMLLDSFEHAEADFAARLLIDARNEAETGHPGDREVAPRAGVRRDCSDRAGSGRTQAHPDRRWPELKRC